MQGNRRWALVAAFVVIAIAAFAIARSGSSEKAPANAVAQIQVRSGKPVGGIKKIVVQKGGHVHFTVTSDVADEIHVHGYDFHKDVAKGGSVTFDFRVPTDGSFVIELEKLGQQIADLQVKP